MTQTSLGSVANALDKSWKKWVFKTQLRHYSLQCPNTSVLGSNVLVLQDHEVHLDIYGYDNKSRHWNIITLMLM